MTDQAEKNEDPSLKRADEQNIPPEPQDASKGEVALYAFGSIENSISDQFFNILNSVLIVAMHVNPLLIGLVLAVKTLWDSVTDPVMAYITDNTRSRWGRRRPYILVGGVLRVSLLVLICMFMPHGGHLTSNPVMEAQKYANEGISEAESARKTALKSLEQIDSAEPAVQSKIIEMLKGIRISAEDAYAKIGKNLPVLREDASERAGDAAKKKAQFEELKSAPGGSDSRRLEIAGGLSEAAHEKQAKADELIAKADRARSNAIAAKFVAGHILAVHGEAKNDESLLADRAKASLLAATAFADAGLHPLEDIFTMEPQPLPVPSKKKSIWQNLADGFTAYLDPKNYEQRDLIVFVLVVSLIFTALSTMQGVPYFALGIELCPSYSGRTLVVTYRALINQIAGLVAPWIPVLCFSLYFATAMEGLLWVAVFACIIGIPSTVLMCWFVRERTEISVHKKRKVKLFRSIWEVAKSVHFLKICFIYCFIGLVNGVFVQIGFFLNVYWVTRSALSGATLGAWVSMVAWGLGFLMLPIINWACNRFQKHRVLQAAIIWMAIGTAMKWICMNPEHPEYQFVLPHFCFLHCSSYGAILSPENALPRSKRNCIAATSRRIMSSQELFPLFDKNLNFKSNDSKYYSGINKQRSISGHEMEESPSGKKGKIT